MRPYEETLNKIAPIFYKFLLYEEYTHNASKYGIIINTLINSYLASAKIYPTTYSLYLPAKGNYYYFYIRDIYYFIAFRVDNMTYKKAVMLTTNDKVTEVAYVIYLDGLIVNMILNKFSAENEREIEKFNDGDINPTNTFIALVGRDTYETIRRNIK